MRESILDILREYPADVWKFSFSDSRVKSQWPIRAGGTCINSKGARVSFEIYAPPPDSTYELGYVKVTVDTVSVFRQEWDGYKLGPERSAREEVLHSLYWKWIGPLYEANLRHMDAVRRKEQAADAVRQSRLHDEALGKL